MRRVNDRALQTATLLVFLCAACTVGDVDLTQKRPPCASPLVASCDGTRCVEAGETCPDAGTDAGDACSGAFAVDSLRLLWATPNTLTVGWDVTADDGADFGRYEVDLATSADGIDGDAVQRYSPDTNPELGHYALPRAEGEEVVRQAQLRGLDVGTEYFVRLRAYDRAGAFCELELPSLRTAAEAIGEVAIYQDEDPRGWRLPIGDCWDATMEGPHADGSAHFEHEVRCFEPPPHDAGVPDAGPPEDASTCLILGSAACWTNFRFAGLGAELDAIGRGSFPTAFLEFQIDVEGRSGEAYYAEVNLNFMPGDGGEASNHRMHQLTFPEQGGYHRFQLPLGEFERVTPDLLRTSRLAQVMWGSNFPEGTVVRIDEVRVRWL